MEKETKMEKQQKKKRVLVFASGDAEGGGSGFQEMVEYSRTDPAILDAEIVGVVSNYENGGLRKRSDALKVPFLYWKGPFVAKGEGPNLGYRDIWNMFWPDYAMCSGWLKPVRGLDPRRVVNIHPALLPGDGTSGEFGGFGKWGHHVHETVYRAYQEGRIHQSGVTMHFVTDYDIEKKYDVGPVIWQMPIELRPDDDPDSIGSRVNQVERAWQSYILNLVVNGTIFLQKSKGEFKVGCTDIGLARAIPGLCVSFDCALRKEPLIEEV